MFYCFYCWSICRVKWCVIFSLCSTALSLVLTLLSLPWSGFIRKSVRSFSAPGTIWDIFPSFTPETLKKFSGNGRKALPPTLLSFPSASSTVAMCLISFPRFSLSLNSHSFFPPSNRGLMQYAVFPHLSANEADEYS